MAAKKKAKAKAKKKAEPEPQRNEKGQFPPGVSGNPGGRPKVAKEIREKIRLELVDDAIEKWRELLSDPSGETRRKTVLDILSFAIGKPVDASAHKHLDPPKDEPAPAPEVDPANLPAPEDLDDETAELIAREGVAALKLVAGKKES